MKKVGKDDFIPGFVSHHNHGSVDYTSVADGHVHQCLDVTSPPIPSEDGVCLVQKFRTIRFRILGRPTRSPLVRPQFFSFEDVDSRGRALNLGETVLLQEEVNPLLTELRKRDIIVTAVHNHWLFEEPRAMYMHFESVEPPLEFARKVREAFRVLKD